MAPSKYMQVFIKYEKAKDMTLNDEPPRSAGVRYALVYARKLNLLYLVMTAQAE